MNHRVVLLTGKTNKNIYLLLNKSQDREAREHICSHPLPACMDYDEGF